MVEELSLSSLKISSGDSGSSLGTSLAHMEFPAQESNYGNSPSLAEDDDYEHQEWTGSASEKCNLIVNYLPHETGDVSLKVT